jgi:hypothetical protein
MKREDFHDIPKLEPASKNGLAESLQALERVKAELLTDELEYLNYRMTRPFMDGPERMRGFFGNRTDYLEKRYQVEIAERAAEDAAEAATVLKCFHCDKELDEDEEADARADLRWCDPTCDDCDFNIKRTGRP